MLLKDILPGQKSELKIKDIAIDSRDVRKGSLFFALKGKATNGTKFIETALKNGAVGVVCCEDEEVSLRDVEVFKYKNPHEVLVFALNKFHNELPNNIFAVTGTNGKTSVAEFVRQMLELIDKKTASIGTLGIICDDKNVYQDLKSSTLTTPDVVSLYKNLTTLKKHNIDNVIIEASSIGIEQGRMDGLDFKAAAFTNFTQDHLDYHGDMQEYLRCKAMLFSKLTKNGLAVINSDIENYPEICEAAKKGNNKIISYGKSAQNIKLISAKTIDKGQEIKFIINGKEFVARLSILGDFQAMNVLCALSLVNFYYDLSDSDLNKVIKGFSNLRTATGRMEEIATLKNNAKIYIDFAHTPDALENVLVNARKFTKGRLLVLFGCGGDRDIKKRPQMGKIASDLADLVIVSDDNPRTENSQKIRQDILVACNLSKTTEFANRQNAIKESIKMLKENDVLIIAGKGHEKYQIIGNEKLPFDEESIIRSHIDRKFD